MELAHGEQLACFLFAFWVCGLHRINRSVQ